MDDLKPCPFCGGEDCEIRHETDNSFYVFCKDCGVMCEYAMSEYDCKVAWNRRANGDIGEGIKMNKSGEMTTCDGLSSTEPAKEMLENMDVILTELGQELVRIDSAIYSPRVAEERKNDPVNECLLGTLNRQRATAQKLLDLAIHIREGLW